MDLALRGDTVNGLKEVFSGEMWYQLGGLIGVQSEETRAIEPVQPGEALHLEGAKGAFAIVENGMGGSFAHGHILRWEEDSVKATSTAWRAARA